MIPVTCANVLVLPATYKVVTGKFFLLNAAFSLAFLCLLVNGASCAAIISSDELTGCIFILSGLVTEAGVSLLAAVFSF